MRNVGGRAMLGDPTVQVLAKKILRKVSNFSFPCTYHQPIELINFNVGHLQ